MLQMKGKASIGDTEEKETEKGDKIERKIRDTRTEGTE